MEDLLRRIRKVQAADFRAWHSHSFRRHVTEFMLDAEGRTKSRKTRQLLLTPAEDGGFREELVSLNGGSPSRRAVKKYRDRREFTGKYRALLQGDGSEAESRGFSLDQLTELPGPELAGGEMLGGEPCWRIDFHPPREGESGGRLASALLQAMEGSLWVTQEGLHILKAEARTVRSVSMYWSLAKVHSLSVELDQGRVEAGAWLPERIEMELDRRILFDRDRKRTVWTYTGYQAMESPGR